MALHAMVALGQVAHSYGFPSKMKAAVAAEDIKLVAPWNHQRAVPRPIDAKTVVRFLTSSRPTRADVHISKRSSTTSRGNLVLVGVVTFEDLYRASRMESHRWQKRASSGKWRTCF
jgi:hypothetical protein